MKEREISKFDELLTPIPLDLPSVEGWKSIQVRENRRKFLPKIAKDYSTLM